MANKSIQYLLAALVFALVFFALAAALQQVYNVGLVPASTDPATEMARLVKIKYLTAVLLLSVIPLFVMGGTAVVMTLGKVLRVLPAVPKLS